MQYKGNSMLATLFLGVILTYQHSTNQQTK